MEYVQLRYPSGTGEVPQFPKIPKVLAWDSSCDHLKTPWLGRILFANTFRESPWIKDGFRLEKMLSKR